MHCNCLLIHLHTILIYSILLYYTNGVTLIVNKMVENAVLGCNLKNNRMISVCFQGKPLNITVIQVYAPTSNAEEVKCEVKSLSHVRLFVIPWTIAYQAPWSMGFSRQEYWSGVPFPSPGHLECRRSWVQNEAGQRLTEFCQENTLVIAITFSNNMRGKSTHEHHQMVNIQFRLIMFFAAEDGEAL